MTDKFLCPDAAGLQRFLSGRTSEAEADEIERHLASCDRCCETSRSLCIDDLLTSALKTDSGLDTIVGDAAVQTTMARMMAMYPGKDGKAPEETLAASGESTDDAWSLDELLDPPQGEGELGRFADYRIVRVLGAGGMGIVLEAEDPHLQRRVALKVMHRRLAAHVDNRRRFVREARAAAAIDHPRIVTVFQVGEHRRIPFLAMQLLKGESLEERLRDGARMPLPECLRIGRETAEVLAVAHERGLIHRDIKPANIWLESPGGSVKLVDFGLAHGVEDDIHLTQTGTILGTPAYMAPEQARGDRGGPRADLFSLGAVLYRLSTGHSPFQGPSTLAILTALAVERPKPPRELNPAIPSALDNLIERLLAKNPSERIESAEATAQAIEAIEKECLKLQAVAAQHGGAPARRSPRWPLVAGAAAFMLATIVLIVRDKDGKELARIQVPDGSNVTINENKTEVTGAVHDAEKPIVVVRSGGKKRNEFKRIAEAIATLHDGDVIEIHGNGPFPVPAVRLQNKGLTLRAAAGYRPRLVARGSFNEHTPWFDIQGGQLTLEGCDFHAEGKFYAFRGGGAEWIWHNCRFLTTWPTGGLTVPRIDISDSLFCSVGHAIQLMPSAELRLENTVMHTGTAAIVCLDGGGQKLLLRRNTFLAGGPSAIAIPDSGAQPIVIQAEGNIFDLRDFCAVLGGGFHHTSLTLDTCLRQIDWEGRANLFCGPHGPAIHAKDEGRKVEGLSVWRESLNSDEAGSIETPELSFTWDSARVLPIADAVKWLRGVVDGAKQRDAKELHELGPDWELIGPGQAYVRALAARDEPVPAEKLHPEPLDEGPFVLLRDDQPLGGHITLQEAIASAKSGDTIEIRTDGPFAGATTADGGRKLVIRAAPGYLPVLEGVLHCPHTGDVTVEGIHFHGGGADELAICIGPVHLVNCSFAANSRRMSFAMPSLTDNEGGSEIINCWAPGRIHLNHDTGTSISMCNSVVGSFYLYSKGAGEQRLRIERSVVWNPGCGASGLALAYHPACLFERQGEGRLTVSAKQSLLEAGQGLVPTAELNVLGWKNAANLYRTGTSNLVERLRTECVSGDEGSLSAAPFDFEPLQWRLLPGSVGYQSGPDGKDLGADITRIAAVAPMPAK